MNLGYWWCPECKKELHNENVTFEERCDSCGTEVKWVGHKEACCDYCSSESNHRTIKRNGIYDRSVETLMNEIAPGLRLSKYESFKGENRLSQEYYINWMSERIGEPESELINFCPMCGRKLEV